MFYSMSDKSIHNYTFGNTTSSAGSLPVPNFPNGCRGKYLNFFSVACICPNTIGIKYNLNIKLNNIFKF